MKKVVVVLSLLTMVFGFSAFECSSAELTGAKMYIAQKHYDKAKESLLKDIAKNPASDEAWYLLGYLYGEEDSIALMNNAFDKSLGVSKKFEKDITEFRKYAWQTSFNKGVAAFNAGAKTTKPDSMKINFEKAAEFFGNSTICQPDSTIGYENLVSIYFNMNTPEKAKPALEKLVGIGRPASAFAELGQLYNLEGLGLMDNYRASKNASDSVNSMAAFQKAIDVLKKGNDKFPGNADILLQLGNSYYSRGEIDVAIASFKLLVEQIPTNKDFRYAYGVVLLKGKKYDESVKQLEEAVKLDPKNTDCIYNLAAAYINWGNQLRDAAVKAETDDKSYQEKFSSAAPYLEKYLEIKPNEARVWLSLGQVYANMGNQEKAEAAFKKAEQVK
jgi:tetratricopeptide (TPR) repeat protein